MAKITIFGLAGTGTSTQGRLLAERLNYEFMSPGMIFRSQAKKLGMSLHEYEAYIDGNRELDKAMDEEIREFGRTHDNFVVEGRLAWFLIPDSIKIKLTCDFDIRTARVAERDGQTHEEAKQATLVREVSNEERYIANHGINKLDSDDTFDLIVDTGVNSIEETTEAMLRFIGDRSQVGRLDLVS